MATPETVLEYWVDEIGPKRWFSGSPELDADIKERFGATWKEAHEGACGLWLTSPVGILGYIVLTDQFPRNMFRGHADAFATDRMARAACKIALEKGWDMRIPEPVRQFFYMPLMHSENLMDQDRCVRLLVEKMPKTGKSTIPHARVHRDIVRRFGRFPYRNDALGRATTEAEMEWIQAGGYAHSLRAVRFHDG